MDVGYYNVWNFNLLAASAVFIHCDRYQNNKEENTKLKIDSPNIAGLTYGFVTFFFKAVITDHNNNIVSEDVSCLYT